MALVGPHCRVFPQRLELYLVQDAHVLVGQQVDHEVVPLLKGVDVVEAEKRIRPAPSPCGCVCVCSTPVVTHVYVATQPLSSGACLSIT